MELLSRGELESKYEKDLLKLSQRHRMEFLKLAGKPPDFRRVPIAFWKRVSDEEAAALIILLSDIYRLNAIQHGMNDRSANSFAVAFANRRAASVAKSYAENSLAKALVAQKKIVQSGQTLTRPAAIEVADSIFGERRNRALVSTEVTTASVGGGEVAMELRGLKSPTDTWIVHPERSQSGVCKTCAPFHMTVRTLWGRVFPGGPPVHKHCCCEIRYTHA